MIELIPRVTRRLLAIAIAGTLLGCSHTTEPADELTNPIDNTPTDTFTAATVAGTYALSTVNNQALPYQSNSADGLGGTNTVNITTGTLTLQNSSSYSFTFDFEFCKTSPPPGCIGGAAAPSTSTGTFTTSGSNRVNLTENSTQKTMTITWSDRGDEDDNTASSSLSYSSGIFSFGMLFLK